MTSTLLATMEEFQRNRVASTPPEVLKIGADQRKLLVETADRAGFVKEGSSVPPFTLEKVTGETLTRDGLLSAGPLVMIFFRFAGCPVCNVALPYYDRELAPKLRALGIGLVAVSPQVPERLDEIRAKHDLSFTVATDRDNTLARHFGILYSYDEPSREAAIKAGKPIGDVTGTGTWELPMPAVVILDSDGTVIFVDVSPDWMVRTEPQTILDIVAEQITNKGEA